MANIAVPLTVPMKHWPDASGIIAHPTSDTFKPYPTKTVSGHVYDTNHAPKVGIPVLLFRQSDNQYVAQTTTDAQGIYSFSRDAKDTNTYYTVAYVTVGTQVHGTSDRGLVPV